jgi:YggT family protein
VIITIIIILLQLYLFVLLGYVILSFVTAYARLEFDSPVYKVQRVFTALCDPVLNPIRRIIPPARIGNVGLDVSVLVLFLVLQLIVIPILATH